MQAATHATAGQSVPFIMLNATVCEPTDELLNQGYYDPQEQTWNGPVEIGAGTYSKRSTGSNGDYSSMSDD